MSDLRKMMDNASNALKNRNAAEVLAMDTVFSCALKRIAELEKSNEDQARDLETATGLRDRIAKLEEELDELRAELIDAKERDESS